MDCLLKSSVTRYIWMGTLGLDGLGDAWLGNYSLIKQLAIARIEIECFCIYVNVY